MSEQGLVGEEATKAAGDPRSDGMEAPLLGAAKRNRSLFTRGPPRDEPDAAASRLQKLKTAAIWHYYSWIC